MSERSRSARRAGAASGLPDVLPIFPLTGVLLLPRGAAAAQHLRAALSGDDPRRARRRAPDRHGPAERSDKLGGMNPPVYPIGCAGRITQFSETDDGRFLITLTGVSRFRIGEELPLLERLSPRRSRTGSRSRRDREIADAPQFDRARLMRGLKTYLRPAAAVGRLERDREGAGRAADHLDRDGLPVRAEREAGAARSGRSRTSARRC